MGERERHDKEEHMMNVSAMTNPGNNIMEELEELTKLDFNIIELDIEGPEAKSDELDLKQIKEFQRQRKKEKKPVKFIAHAPWELNFGSPYDRIRKGAVEEAKEILKTLEELDIDFVTMHTYSHTGSFYKSQKKHEIVSSFIESAQELIPFAEERGITIGFENIGNLIKLKDFERIFDEIPDLKITFDIGHAYLESEKESKLNDFIENNIERIEHVHICDNFGDEDDHLPLGAGEIEWKKTIKALKEAGYDGHITAEVHSHDREYLYISKRKLERAWRNQ